jgi:hypothetical protein
LHGVPALLLRRFPFLTLFLLGFSKEVVEPLVVVLLVLLSVPKPSWKCLRSSSDLILLMWIIHPVTVRRIHV